MQSNKGLQGIMRHAAKEKKRGIYQATRYDEKKDIDFIFAHVAGNHQVQIDRALMKASWGKTQKKVEHFTYTQIRHDNDGVNKESSKSILGRLKHRLEFLWLPGLRMDVYFSP